MSRKQLADASWFKFWRSLCAATGSDLCHSLPKETNTQAVFHSLDRRQRQALDSKAMRVFATWTVRTRLNSWTVKKGTPEKVHQGKHKVYDTWIWCGALWSHALRHEHPFSKALLKRMAVVVRVWMLLRRRIRELLQDKGEGQTTGFPDATETGHKLTHFITLFCSLSCSARISQPIPKVQKMSILVDSKTMLTSSTAQGGGGSFRIGSL